MPGIINLNNTVPTAPAGKTNITFQIEGTSVSTDPSTGFPVYRASAYIGSVAPTGNSIQEVPAGSINGTNVTFTLSETPIAGSLLLTRNGIVQDPLNSPVDFTISTNTITFSTPPVGGVQPDRLLATYSY